MSYAIIATGGKQYRVEPGRFYDFELLDAEVDSTLIIDQVLLVAPDGEDVLIGQPLVSGASVRTKVLQHGKAKKILIYKMRPKKNYRRKNGHRQPFTRLLVESIDLGTEAASAEVAVTSEAVAS